MNRIVDDATWEIGMDWNPADSWSVWGDTEIFFSPDDMDEIAAGWEKTRG